MASAEITVKSLNQQLEEVFEEESKIYPLRFSDTNGKQGLIIINHHMNKDSMGSIKVLAAMQKASDIGVIGRSIFESVLNMGLLVHFSVNDGVNRYRLYSSIESLKVYKQMSQIEKETAAKIFTVENIRKWETNLRQYEREYGIVTSSWSGKTAIEICQILDEKYPPVIKSKHFYEFLYCQIYRYGSAAAHRSGQGLARHVNIITAPASRGRRVHTARSREEGLVFNYFHSLIAFLSSMRIIGKAFNLPSLEDYFQKKVGLLIAGYPETVAINFNL